MSIALYQHNADAYFAAVSMLSETGKAAIIHPTGTGKSFIGFQLCADNAGKRVCWLSPSEYIYRTQLENLEAAGGDIPRNIRFCTYARLMLMDESEMLEIRPDIVVLDEFHRCGARQWGGGVRRLLALFPQAQLLGMSATNIRYLDNRRDMADELFDGNVASEMTLGEAIVRGILKAPTYVLSVFAYQQDYERLRSRVRSAKNKAVKIEAERLLEALRRALENADGLDVIFDRHMKDRSGKYLVFCASIRHMQEMMSHVSEWFGKIDDDPHVYSAVADDPASDRAFRAFKGDDSDHLKLLFCVDMLNEGVHVEDVSGVILFRPTVSPIIYKQQIGRALSASKSKDPIIFDIVNNIENLYSIGALEREMDAAADYFRFRGDGEEIVHDRFRLIDEVHDAGRLFDRLNDTLSASWDLMYECARQYYLSKGDLDVPWRYKTPEGYSLGAWLMTQRRVYSGEQYGSLDESRIRKLNEIGMRWESHLEQSWEKCYRAAREYSAIHGDLKAGVREVTDDGVRLGAWLAVLRNYRKNGVHCTYLSEERIAALDRLGMLWDVSGQLWEDYYAAAARYYREHGNLEMSSTYVAQDGLRVGAWLQKMRSLRKGSRSGAELTPEQISRLDSIGMVWESRAERAWEAGLREARSFFASNGDLNVPRHYVSPSGYRLGRWVSARREKGRNKHTPAQRKELDALGMIWKKEDPWEIRFELAKAYYEEHGDLNMPAQYRAEGIWLAKWLNEQRQIHIGNRAGQELKEDQIRRLDSIGMIWENRSRRQWAKAWEECYLDVRSYYEQNGDLKVPGDYKGTSGKILANWLLRQRDLRKDGKLSSEQIHMLNEIGMVWEAEDPWEIGFQHARAYYQMHGDLNVAAAFVCKDGYRLGLWIKNQRAGINRSDPCRPLTEERKKRLDDIGMKWRPAEEQWMEAYAHAKAYLQLLNGEPWRVLYRSPDGFKTGEWIRGQMRNCKNRTISRWKQDLLAEIGLNVEEDTDTVA